VSRLFAVAILTAASTTFAAPNLKAPRAAGPLTVYADDRRPNLFYYGPGDIAVETDADGRPGLSFLQVRYTGTASAGTQGAAVFRSLLTLSVTQTGAGPQALAAVRLAARLPKGAELRPLPIHRLDAKLVYTPVAAETPTTLPEGHFEAEDDPSASGSWTRRTYAIALDVAAAQLLADSMRQGRLLLSLDYAFHARPAQADVDVLVRAGATAIAVDIERWPTLLRRIDVNEQLPPGYAALDVYCYDFNNGLRPDLYEKQVEIEADGVGGGKVVASTTFGSTQADLYARSVRFPVGVRLDRPYRYRVSETATDGRTRLAPWATAVSWDRILDVTSPPAKQVRPSPEEQP